MKDMVMVVVRVVVVALLFPTILALKKIKFAKRKGHMPKLRPKKLVTTKKKSEMVRKPQGGGSHGMRAGHSGGSRVFLGGGDLMSMGAYGRYTWLWGHMVAWT